MELVSHVTPSALRGASGEQRYALFSQCRGHGRPDAGRGPLPSGSGKGEGLPRAEHCLATPHPPHGYAAGPLPLPGGERADV